MEKYKNNAEEDAKCIEVKNAKNREIWVWIQDNRSIVSISLHNIIL